MLPGLPDRKVDLKNKTAAEGSLPRRSCFTEVQPQAAPASESLSIFAWTVSITASRM